MIVFGDKPLCCVQFYLANSIYIVVSLLISLLSKLIVVSLGILCVSSMHAELFSLILMQLDGYVIFKVMLLLLASTPHTHQQRRTRETKNATNSVTISPFTNPKIGMPINLLLSPPLITANKNWMLHAINIVSKNNEIADFTMQSFVTPFPISTPIHPVAENRLKPVTHLLQFKIASVFDCGMLASYRTQVK
jgi:hypothetical protein